MERQVNFLDVALSFASGGMTVLPESLGVATEYLVVACLTGSVKTSFSALHPVVSFVCRSLRPE
jgi:hypothetical protein